MTSFSKTVKRCRPLCGTLVEITAAGSDEAELNRAVSEAFAAVAEVERQMNYFDPESEVSRLNREAAQKPVRVSEATFAVLKEADLLGRYSGGIFDIAAAGAMRAGKPNQKTAAHEVIILEDGAVRFVTAETKIDLSGIAKGFAVDRAIEVLSQAGIATGLVNAGGDLRAFGPCAFPVWLRDPEEPDCCRLQVPLRNAALANSGGYFGAGFARSNRAILAAGVQAPTCMRADGLTKVLMAKGSEADGILRESEASGYWIERKTSGELHVEFCGRPWH